jgi:uncharacterized membrane protein YfcA
LQAHLSTAAILCASAFAAGVMNSMAGGGSLLSFPALLWAGVSPTVANATSTMALLPGSASAFWTYRHDLVEHEGGGDRRTLLLVAIPSVMGGGLGAWLVLRAGDALFAKLVPWLILGATVLFVIRGPIARLAKPHGDGHVERVHGKRLVALVGFQLLVATYGGFFGAGIGILMLAALAMAGLTSMHRMNAVKNFAAVAINVVAAVLFVVGRKVDWQLAGMMAVGAVLGGVVGARVAKRLGHQFVRASVVVIGITITVVMFARQLRGT